MKWIKIIQSGNSKSGKTKIFDVVTNEDNMQVLGEIRWAGAWRKYTFQPVSNTMFDHDCLREIADFIEMHTKDHKKRG